jgi:hypothetical protein
MKLREENCSTKNRGRYFTQYSRGSGNFIVKTKIAFEVMPFNLSE